MNKAAIKEKIRRRESICAVERVLVHRTIVINNRPINLECSIVSDDLILIADF